MSYTLENYGHARSPRQTAARRGEPPLYIMYILRVVGTTVVGAVLLDTFTAIGVIHR